MRLMLLLISATIIVASIFGCSSDDDRQGIKYLPYDELSKKASTQRTPLDANILLAKYRTQKTKQERQIDYITTGLERLRHIERTDNSFLVPFYWVIANIKEWLGQDPNFTEYKRVASLLPYILDISSKQAADIFPSGMGMFSTSRRSNQLKVTRALIKLHVGVDIVERIEKRQGAKYSKNFLSEVGFSPKL